MGLARPVTSYRLVTAPRRRLVRLVRLAATKSLGPSRPLAIAALSLTAAAVLLAVKPLVIISLSQASLPHTSRLAVTPRPAIGVVGGKLFCPFSPRKKSRLRPPSGVRQPRRRPTPSSYPAVNAVQLVFVTAARLAPKLTPLRLAAYSKVRTARRRVAAPYVRRTATLAVAGLRGRSTRRPPLCLRLPRPG